MAKKIKPNYQRVWAELGDSTKPVDSYIQNGWLAVKPPRQYMNWIQNRQDSMLAYINQLGMSEWDTDTDYHGGAGTAECSFVQGSDGKVYRCLADNGPSVVGAVGKDPTNQPTNAAFWQVAFATKQDYDSTAATVATHTTQIGNGSGVTDPAAWRTAIGAVSVASELLTVAQGFIDTSTTTPSIGYQAGVVVSVNRDDLGRYTLTFADAFDNTGGTVKMVPTLEAFSAIGSEGRATRVTAISTTTVSVIFNNTLSGAAADPSIGFFYKISGKLA